MEAAFIFLSIGVLACVYLANLDDSRRAVGGTAPPQQEQPVSPSITKAILTWLLYGFIAFPILYSAPILYMAYTSHALLLEEDSSELLVEVDQVAATIYFLLAIILSGAAAGAVGSYTTRHWVKRFVSRHYNPESSVHTTAFVLVLVSISVLFGQFVQQGGLPGLADGLEETNSLTVGSIIFDALLRVVLAFLGVGLAIRRTLPQTLVRLGLHLPTWDDLRWGIGGGIAIFAASRAILLVWVALISPEQFAEQTSAANRIAQQFDTLSLAFTLSASAAIGEEILFRGALQPVFGWIPTSIFFALLHIQYTLTPAALIIFVVSLGLGWIRIRQSTTAAIVAHFLYNFVPLMLQVIIGSAVSAP